MYVTEKRRFSLLRTNNFTVCDNIRLQPLRQTKHAAENGKAKNAI